MAPAEPALRLLIARLTVIGGFGAAFALTLAAILPGGSDQVAVLVAGVCVVAAVSAVAYLIVAHRNARQSQTSRPEDARNE
jgi:hypothetical protein